MPGLEIHTIPIADLSLDRDNARQHDGKNLRAIKDSIREFGLAAPIVVSATDRHVIAGNGTLQALQALGRTEVDVVWFRGTPSQATALAIAMNRTAELATWDTAVLSRQLAQLSSEFRLEGLGFGDLDIATLFPAQDLDGVFELQDPELEDYDPEPKQRTQKAQFALLFDTEAQESRFHRWLKKLDKRYPGRSAGARIDAHILEQHPDLAE